MLSISVHPQIATLNAVKPRLCVLNNRMQQFIQQFLYYACYEVVEPSWKAFMEGLKGCESVEELIASQHGFLDGVLRECMLSNTKLLKVRYTLAFNDCRRWKNWWMFV
jgi:hypothetical protein